MISPRSSRRTQAKGCILGGHGVTAWGNTSEEAEAGKLALDHWPGVLHRRELQARTLRSAARRPDPLPDAERRAKAAALAPTLRSVASYDNPMVGHFNDDERVLDFLAQWSIPGWPS